MAHATELAATCSRPILRACFHPDPTLAVKSHGEPIVVHYVPKRMA